MKKPYLTVAENTWSFLRDPMVNPTGFREYDARWKFPQEINLPGITALGLGLGTQIQNRSIEPVICVGNDYRDYSVSIKNALIIGLMQAGITVKDIGTALSPMAYFAQFHLNVPAVAMVTASHNPNGWTGVKMGFERPLTHGTEEMAELRKIVLEGKGKSRPGGKYEIVNGVIEAYLHDLVGDFRMNRKLTVVCATGNGTAGAFAPELFKRLGVDVIPSHNHLDYHFPNYNPNPEAMEMLEDMADCVIKNRADLALGFDGDGDRCGVVDNEGNEIFADKVGLLLARELSKTHPDCKFIADVKSTGLFSSDPVLKANGAKVEYWKTGHSHMKRRVKETNALAGFEKSGHYFFSQPIGRGYDCGMRVAVEICKLMDSNPNSSMAELRKSLPVTYSSPTMSPYCSDEQKYNILKRIVKKLEQKFDKNETISGRQIENIVTVNGARVILDNGAWGLVRASSNTPNLVVVCESPESENELKRIFDDLNTVIRTEPLVGQYDQSL